MGRIRSGSTLVEPPLKNYSVLIGLVDYLIKKGVDSVDLLLEATVLEVKQHGSVTSIATSPLSFIIEPGRLDYQDIRSICQDICRLHEIVRDAWAETAQVSTVLVLELLKTLTKPPGSRLELDGLVVHLFEAPSCKSLFIIETLALKYPVVGFHEFSDGRFVGELTRLVRKPEIVPLIACLDENIRLIVFLDISRGKTLQVKVPSNDLEYFFIMQALLDALAYWERTKRMRASSGTDGHSSEKV